MGMPLEKKEDMDSVESFRKFADGKCDTFLLLGEFSRMSGCLGLFKISKPEIYGFMGHSSLEKVT